MEFKIIRNKDIESRWYLEDMLLSLEAKLAIFEFIESWYNNHRIHSTLGYITPKEKFNQYKASLAIV